MAIIGEKITLDKTLVGNIARNQMESKMELTTKGALYVGTGETNSVIPDGGGTAVRTIMGKCWSLTLQRMLVGRSRKSQPTI